MASPKGCRYSSVMGALAKSIAGGSLALLVACASLAGIDDPQPNEATNGTSPDDRDSSGAPPTASSSGTSSS
ncbi:MAG: hypothetical protein K0S65_14, partial [Labilithrix sp.]|nr:hypothetical protein [Labilithrix sp.]